MESVIKIIWRGNQSEIIRAIESVKPDDSDTFTIEYATVERDFFATITIKSMSLSSAKADGRRYEYRNDTCIPDRHLRFFRYCRDGRHPSARVSERTEGRT